VEEVDAALDAALLAALDDHDDDEESTGLMQMRRPIPLTKQMRTNSMLGSSKSLLFAAKMLKPKEAAPPTWFEGRLFVLLDKPYVTAGICAYLLISGAFQVMANLITVSCTGSNPAAVAAGGFAFYWITAAYALSAMQGIWRPRSRPRRPPNALLSYLGVTESRATSDEGLLGGGGTLTDLAPPARKSPWPGSTV